MSFDPVVGSRYTPLDPKIQVWCDACCTNDHHDECPRSVTYAEDTPRIKKGTYPCACLRCRSKGWT